MTTPKQEMAVATLCEANPNHGDPPIPMGVPLLLLPSSARRLPPPCWTPDETSSLIDFYRDKWYSLRRGNLRASHWQEVADQIHSRCPDVSPSKTAVQCRHKMEKLRKRYRAELLRAKSLPHHRFSSSWIYFSRMDSMEKMNPSPSLSQTPFLPASAAFHSPPPIPPPEEEDEDDDDDDLTLRSYNPPRTTYPHPPTDSAFTSTNTTPFNAITNNNYYYYGGRPFNNHSAAAAAAATTTTNTLGSPSSMGIEMPVNAAKKSKTTTGFRGHPTREEAAAVELVDAIRMLGQGFVRMEQMKIDMMRETERLRLDLEMKRTQLLLDSQHRIVHAFAQAWTDIINDIP